jgi:predicted ATP-dependent serine protease
MADLNIDPNSLQPIETGTIFDKFMSNEGGFLPGTNIMAAGAPGVGKTTLLLELLEGAQQNGHKVLFISAEMNKMDMARYTKRFPNWNNLPILFLNEFTDQCPKTVVEGVIDQGWDLVLTDSYTEVNDTVKEACNLTRSKTEKWFLDLMISNNEGHNKSKTFTTFITILQLSKGGTFVGSNKLKHMTSAMMDINWEGGENSGQRYMEFTKNRCGMVGQKLYYRLGETVQLDEDRFIKELEYKQILEDEGASNDFDWDDIFKKGSETSDVEMAKEI